MDSVCLEYSKLIMAIDLDVITGNYDATNLHLYSQKKESGGLKLASDTHQKGAIYIFLWTRCMKNHNQMYTDQNMVHF